MKTAKNIYMGCRCVIVTRPKPFTPEITGNPEAVLLFAHGDRWHQAKRRTKHKVLSEKQRVLPVCCKSYFHQPGAKVITGKSSLVRSKHASANSMVGKLPAVVRNSWVRRCLRVTSVQPVLSSENQLTMKRQNAAQSFRSVICRNMWTQKASENMKLHQDTIKWLLHDTIEYFRWKQNNCDVAFCITIEEMFLSWLR